MFQKHHLNYCSYKNTTIIKIVFIYSKLIISMKEQALLISKHVAKMDRYDLHRTKNILGNI